MIHEIKRGKLQIMLFLGLFLVLSPNVPIAVSQQKYWNQNLPLTPLRLPAPPVGYEVEYLDCNQDGKPDAIKSVSTNNTPILWLDNDGSMKKGDLEGNMVNSVLLIDRNKDGFYGGQGDLIVNWTDANEDGQADMQFVIEYPNQRTEEVWPNGHYMIIKDLSKDNVFNYINWNTLQLSAWEKMGICNFYEGYSGYKAFMKIHTSTYDMKDLRLNWENPFLFYDEDGDGYSEMAIRFVDSPKIKDKNSPANSYVNRQLEGIIDWVSISVDLDNGNGPGREFHYDFTIGFQGKGFSYMDQKHPLKNIRGLPEHDQFFIDPRYRKLTELIYPDHQSARKLIFNRGDWSRVNFVFDEDGDCARWERVEFYDPLDPFRVGWKNGGIDNNKQSDAAGDRGEWDMDNSGKGKMYISRFDGRLHLYGAEWGVWRIDQNAAFYQGWDRMWLGLDRNPTVFATVKYSDTNNNGFIDFIEYDLDGDKKFETSVNLIELGISDECPLVDVSKYKYRDYTKLMDRMADQMWGRALNAIKVAQKFGTQTLWYAKWMSPKSVRQKYDFGYWVQFYLFKDLEHQFLFAKDTHNLKNLYKAYYSGNWEWIRK